MPINSGSLITLTMPISMQETPIIDGYDFHENNGVINPAFLDVQTTAEEDNRSVWVMNSAW